MKYRQIVKKLKQFGCEEIVDRRSGSHRIWINTNNQKEACIPDWRGRDLKTGTLRAIINQLGIDYKEFHKNR